MKKSIPVFLVILALMGLGISFYTLQLHQNTTGDSFCNINDTFNCDDVNKGEYSEIAGIPVAVVGILGYAVLVLGSLLAMRYTSLWEYVMMAAGLGLAFALYLTSLEAFVIHTYCLACLASQLIILMFFILSIIQFHYVRHNFSGSRTMGEGLS